MDWNVDFPRPDLLPSLQGLRRNQLLLSRALQRLAVGSGVASDRPAEFMTGSNLDAEREAIQADTSSTTVAIPHAADPANLNGARFLVNDDTETLGAVSSQGSTEKLTLAEVDRRVSVLNEPEPVRTGVPTSSSLRLLSHPGTVLGLLTPGA
ncbi:MAG: hypothetical protein IPJ41_03645 [Phycisphaerales bacterium]|nr:hypothetical protein [Phycisphaerales bacterium]